MDLRKNSPTFGQWVGVLLKEDDFKQFYIPQGFAHGFYVLSDVAKFSYSVTEHYNKDDEAGLFWADEEVAINWPILDGQKPILSKKDEIITKNDPLKETNFYPWIKPNSKCHSLTGMLRLHYEILDFYHFIQLNNEEIELRNETYNYIKFYEIYATACFANF